MVKDTGKVNIHGKEYETVASRIQRFRTDENIALNYSIETEMIEATASTVIMKATIKNKDGRIIATGHGEESRTSSMINKTSALENCETSAIGRALAAFGMAGTEFASADEVANAIVQQNTIKNKPIDKSVHISDVQRVKIAKLLSLQGVLPTEMPTILQEYYNINPGDDITYLRAEEIIKDLEK